jgi:biopolymer transport protein ExbD
MRFPRNARIFRGHLDAAPIASVFFLLALFILLNSSLVFPPGIRIELPKAGFEWASTPDPFLVVALDAGGQLYFEQQVVTEDKLRTRLINAVKKNQGPVALVVQADKAVTLESWLRLSQLAREAGIHETLMATRPPLFPAPAANRK